MPRYVRVCRPFAAAQALALAMSSPGLKRLAESAMKAAQLGPGAKTLMVSGGAWSSVRPCLRRRRRRGGQAHGRRAGKCVGSLKVRPLCSCLPHSLPALPVIQPARAPAAAGAATAPMPIGLARLASAPSGGIVEHAVAGRQAQRRLRPGAGQQQDGTQQCSPHLHLRRWADVGEEEERGVNARGRALRTSRGPIATPPRCRPANAAASAVQAAQALHEWPGGCARLQGRSGHKWTDVCTAQGPGHSPGGSRGRRWCLGCGLDAGSGLCRRGGPRVVAAARAAAHFLLFLFCTFFSSQIPHL